MKNLVAFLFLTVLLLVFCYFDFSPALPFDNAARASFVLEEKVEGYDYVQNGDEYIVEVYSDIERFYQKYSDQIKGFNLYFSENVEQIIQTLSGQIYRSQDVEGMKIYYGYTNLYNDFRYVSGKKINVQIAEQEKQVIVGFPLILTGFYQNVILVKNYV